MTLPRFTAGNVGRLTFRDLNDAFEIIDGVDRVQGTAGSMQSPRGRAITAKVTGKQGSNYSWHETYRSGGSFVQYPQGRSSLVDGDQYAVPLIEYGSITLTVGQEVVIFPIYEQDGSLMYIPVAASGVEVFAASVGDSPVPVPPLKRWRYTVTEVSWQPLQNLWQIVDNGRVVQAFNGAENTVDSALLIGVGQGKGPATTVERQPIKPSVIVQVSKDIDGSYFFCCPNGYTFTC